jgi:hypothetical protein
MTNRLLCACALGAVLLPAAAVADPAPFDLTGPSLKISVTRGSATLPISAVPNLASGDKLQIAAALPPDQAAHYVLVTAFMRGATNPPPKNWFFKAETWKKKRNTLTLTVPDGAQQAIVFLVPDTGGGVDAVIGAVRGKPGTFVRASQDLTQAALDRSRLDAFLDGIHRREASDPTKLERVSPLLARSLQIKIDQSCLLKPTDLQAACLTQNHDALVLADSHSSSIAETLAGTPTDIALQLSATPQGGYGYYSPYIGVVRDVARLLGAFQSAQLQYIPALALYRGDALALLLNAAPSFRKPQSVLVTALPPVEPPHLPPLKPTDGNAAVCISRPGFTLPVEGAPLIYSTGFARTMALRVATKDGPDAEIPLTADPEQGGYVAAPGALDKLRLAGVAEGSLHGAWGFQPFDGPKFRLESATDATWRTAGNDPATLVIGRDNAVELDGPAPSCVDGVTMRLGSAGSPQPVAFARQNGRLTVTLPLAKARPGEVTLQISQAGGGQPTSLTLRSYAEASRIDGFALHAGDAGGELSGARLDQVTGLTVDGIAFRPGALSHGGDGDRLALTAAAAANWQPGQAVAGKLSFADGRTAPVRVTIDAPRPVATLIGRSVEPPPAAGPVRLSLVGDSYVAADARLSFSLRAAEPTSFSAATQVEVATADGSATKLLTIADGVALQDPHVVVATLAPGAALGPAAYGPLRWRVIQNGTSGDWQPLATLVRLPAIDGLACPGGDKPCTLSGTRLFLAAAVSNAATPPARVEVPQGFTGSTLAVPRPGGAGLSVALRDAPGAVVTVSSAR